MSASHVSVHRFLETYRGSAFPTRALTTWGDERVIKLRGAGNGSESLLSEFIVNRLASAAGLPVPDASVVGLAHGFPWNYGTDEFYDLVKKSGGPNLGLQVIPGARTVPAEDYAILPRAFVSQVVTLDLLFANFDRPVSSANLLRDSHRQPWIVDHGSCRFLFSPTSAARQSLPINHAFAGREALYDPTLLESLTGATLDVIVREVPELWLEESALSRSFIRERLHDLQRR